MLTYFQLFVIYNPYISPTDKRSKVRFTHFETFCIHLSLLLFLAISYIKVEFYFQVINCMKLNEQKILVLKIVQFVDLFLSSLMISARHEYFFKIRAIGENFSLSNILKYVQCIPCINNNSQPENSEIICIKNAFYANCKTQ